MRRTRRVLSLLALAASLLVVAPARAAPVDVIVTLTPTALGQDDPFGISALPAGPFTATFSFSGPLPANASLDLAALPGAGFTGFSLTIGNTTWTAAHLQSVLLTTNAAGQATEVYAFGLQPAPAPSSGNSGFYLEIPPFAVNVSWYALLEGGCSFSNPLTTLAGGCIAGDPSSIALSQVTGGPTGVPGPAALALFGLGVLALAGVARRAG